MCIRDSVRAWRDEDDGGARIVVHFEPVDEPPPSASAAAARARGGATAKARARHGAWIVKRNDAREAMCVI